ncbi:hypothetical protein [Paracoccus sp. (in: a-proteobacteria)]|uniref:hypothetical protein n=1 Tax=Paracoccus sp. TaxID=267 RepID=UPI0035AFF46A
MSIAALLTALKDQLEAARDADIGGVDMRGFNVAVAPGRFDAHELTRDSFRAPAFRVAFLGAGKSRALANEERLFDAGLGVFVITDRKARDLDGLLLAEWISDRVELWSNHGLRGVGIPKDQRIEALHTGELGDRGVAIHAVVWGQTVRLGHDEIGAGVHDPAALVGVTPADLTLTIEAGDLPDDV